jgi:hypothetical protein
MALKLCFNSEIHRVSKPPVTYKALISFSHELFSSKLPIHWALEYIDDENDKVVLSSDLDYQTLLDDIAKGKSIKIYIAPRAEIPVEHYEKIIEPETDQTFEKIENLHQRIEQAAQFLEEAKISDTQSIQYAPQITEEQPLESTPVNPPTEKCKPHIKHRVLNIMRKLKKSKDSEESQRFEAKLATLMAKLSPDDLQWVTQQANEPHSHPHKHLKERKEDQEGKPGKPHWRFKAAGLIKKLSKPEISEEERQKKEKKLEELKAKMSPEDLQWATEHASKLPENEGKVKRCHMNAQCKAVGILRKIQSLGTSKEDREHYLKKLEKFKEKLSNEEMKEATDKAAEMPKEEDARKPQLRYKARNILRRLMFEPDMSPDERKELEEKMSEMKAKMKPEDQQWIDEKVKKFQDKQKKIEGKCKNGWKAKISGFLKESADQIAGFITGVDKLEKPRHLVQEFAEIFMTLDDQKRNEFNLLMKGVPQKMLDLENERKKIKEERKKIAKEHKRSRSRSAKKEEKALEKKASKEKIPKAEKAEKIKPVKQYEKGVTRKADCLKEVFPDADYEKLLEFVAANEKLQMEDLIESYLAAKN